MDNYSKCVLTLNKEQLCALFYQHKIDVWAVCNYLQQWTTSIYQEL